MHMNRGGSSVEPILKVDRLSKRFGSVVANDKVSFDVRKGEIHCLLGENGAGNGQKELFEVLVGVRQPDSGQILLEGKDVTKAHPKEIMELGVGHIPQVRYSEGLVGDFCISDNLILGDQRSKAFTKGLFLDQQKIDDLFNLTDRIAVIFKGQFLGIFKTEDAKIEEIGLLMAGHKSDEIAA